MLTLDKYNYSYTNGKGVFRLEIADFELGRGEIVFLHGRSGCGKSTFMNLLSGVLRSSLIKQSREVFSNICYVMHESTLLPWLTLGGNLKIEASLRRIECNLKGFIHYCMKFGLPDNIINKLPAELSLGMRQRVEIAKALSFRPHLLLIDESLSGLDRQAKRLVAQELLGISRNLNTAILGTAHQLSDLLMLAQRIYVMTDGKLKEMIEVRERSDDRIYMEPAELIRLEIAKLLLV